MKKALLSPSFSRSSNTEDLKQCHHHAWAQKNVPRRAAALLLLLHPPPAGCRRPRRGPLPPSPHHRNNTGRHRFRRGGTAGATTCRPGRRRTGPLGRFIRKKAPRRRFIRTKATRRRRPRAPPVPTVLHWRRGGGAASAGAGRRRNPALPNGRISIESANGTKLLGPTEGLHIHVCWQIKRQTFCNNNFAGKSKDRHQDGGPRRRRPPPSSTGCCPRWSPWPWPWWLWPPWLCPWAW